MYMNKDKLIFAEAWSRLLTAYLLYTPLVYALSLAAGSSWAQITATIACCTIPWMAVPKKGTTPTAFVSLLIAVGPADQLYQMVVPFVGILAVALLVRKILPGEWLREQEYWISLNPLKWGS